MSAFVVLCATACLVVNGLSFGRDWRLVLLSNFRAHFVAASVILAAVVAFIDFAPGLRLGLAAALLVGAAVSFWTMLDATRRARPSAGGQTLKIAFSNLLEFNLQHRMLFDWVARENPDVIVLAEALLSWRQALPELERDYPYWAGSKLGDVRIYSRLPFAAEPVDLFVEIGHAVIVQLAGLTLVGIHTASPQDLRRSRSLDDLLENVAGHLLRIDGPVAVVGDFNAVPWMYTVRRFQRRIGLACGPGAWRGTFPTGALGRWIPRWFTIPIDIMMAGRGAWVTTRRHGPEIGSDHWPIVAEVVYAGDVSSSANGSAVTCSSGPTEGARRSRRSGA